MSLSAGRCYDCSDIPNSKTCNADGPTSCKTGYFLKDNECLKCSDQLDYCLECANETTCSRCSNPDIFKIGDDGKCTCKLNGASYNTLKK